MSKPQTQKMIKHKIFSLNNLQVCYVVIIHSGEIQFCVFKKDARMHTSLIIFLMIVYILGM
jgi:hypothetical protein